MSFFDEADEPQPRQETTRLQSAARPPRPRARRPPGGSGRPPGSRHQQEVQTRRLVAAGVVVVLVIVMALLIRSCDASATNDSLKSYNSSVYQLIAASTSGARRALADLSRGNLSSVTQSLTQLEGSARTNVSDAGSLQPPGQMATAQSSLLTVLRMRQQGLLLLANNAQPAASRSTSKDAIYQISLGTSLLYASDVLYKSVVAPDIAAALHAAGIPVGTGAGAQPINGAQAIPDLGWLNPTWIATRIGAQLSTAQANVTNAQPGLKHGDQLDSVIVGGITLSSTAPNTVPAAQAGTWTLSVSNGGQTAENNVGCSVTIQGTNDTASSSIATIPQGGTSDCTVQLPSAPPTGAPYTVRATVSKVPGETNLANNTGTYTVTFS